MNVRTIKSLVVGAMAALACACFADSEKVNGYTWTYEIVDGKAVIGSGSNVRAVSPIPTGALTIPAKLGGKPVVRLADFALCECFNITSVTIPASVTSLGGASFAGCFALKSVVIPDTVAEIGDYAFSQCALQCVQIGKKVNTLGKGVFRNSNELRAIIFKTDAPPANVNADFLDGIPATAKIYVPKNAKKWPKGENDLPPKWMDHQLNYGDYEVDVVAKVWSKEMEAYGTVSGGGTYAVGKKASLKATAGKGYVFAGWGDNIKKGFLTYSTTYAYTVTGEETEFVAMFATPDQDIDSFKLDFPPSFTTEEDGWLEINTHGTYVVSASEPKLTFKGLPAGIKYDTKTFKLSGKATKPGRYEVEVSAKNTSVKTAIVQKFKIVVPNFKDDLIKVDDAYGEYIPGLEYNYRIDNAAGCTVTGLPSGFKWTAKDIVDSKTKVVTVEANSFYGAATKPGDYTVYFTKTVKEGTKSVKHTATATFTVGPFPQLHISCEGNGKVTGEGGYPANKKVSLKATPDKGSVFMGWYDGAKLLSQATSFQYVMPYYGNWLTAKFITQQEDAAGVSITVRDKSGVIAKWSEAETIEPFGPMVLLCGVYVEWPLNVSALSLPTVKVSGLPAGLKFTAKDIIDSKTKKVTVPANTIYGVPTAPSKTKTESGITRPIPYQIKITVTTAGKTVVDRVVTTHVDPLNSWAVGTFNGGGANNQVTLSISSAGKISGKVLTDENVTWTLAAPYFSSYSRDDINDPGTYTASVTLTSGKKTLLPINVKVTYDDTLGRGFLKADEKRFTALADVWKVTEWKTIAKAFQKAPSLTFDGLQDLKHNPGEVSLKFASSGAVTVSGVFIVTNASGKEVTYKATGSAVLLPVETPKSDGSFECMVVVVLPAKGDFGGYARIFDIKWDGTRFVVP